MINHLIIDSIRKGVNYSTYRTLIKGLLVEGKSTGNEQSEALFNYSKLNDKRMDRLDKTLKTSTETKLFLDELEDNFTFLVIAEGWCGDAAQIVPILNKIAEATPKISLKMVCRDENDDLMDVFLTNGSKSIPKVIVLDNKNEVIDSWGPRPLVATKMVMDYKETHGALDPEFKKDLQIWYNKDKGNSTQNDIVTLLKASKAVGQLI